MRRIPMALWIVCSMLIAFTHSNMLNELHKQWRKFKNAHPSLFKNKKLKEKKMDWIKKHMPHMGGIKGFKDQFKKHHDKMKEFFHSHHPLSHMMGKRPKCPHLPHLPFHHKPMYPFMHHPFHHPMHPPFHHPLPPMIHHPMPPVMSPNMPPFGHFTPPPPGYTDVHFFGQYTSIAPKTLMLGNGKKIHVTQVTQITVRIDFRVDNKLLARMRNQFAAYHRKWMMVLGGILGGFKGMMPYFKKACHHKRHLGLRKFPKLMNKLVRLHEMIARHQALLRMLNEAHANNEKIALLEQKIKMMEKKFAFLKEKLKFLSQKDEMMDKKLGKSDLSKINF